jgi:AraC-like DNA-binding protein
MNMIGGVKSMIAGCIDKTRRGACGGCARRDACASLFKKFGRFEFKPRTRASTPEWAAEGLAGSGTHKLMAFLGEVARHIEAGARSRKSEFQVEVERTLEPLLADGPVRIDQVARELGYSRQTLYRRLKAEGVTFEQLLEGVRQRLARRLLGKEGLSVKEVAYRLGFSDPAAFSRAFKRWTGRSPREFQAAKGRLH